MKVAVIGAGSWGTALAQTLAVAGHEPMMYARKSDVACTITHDHYNPRYLSDVVLLPSVSASSDIEACLLGASAVVMVTPSKLIRQTACRIAPFVSATTPIIVCSKGVEEGTGDLSLEIVEQECNHRGRLAVLSGPNHAEEIILGIPSGTVIASASEQTQRFFQDLFTTDYLRCYASYDCVGVELCAAFKNVIAIAVGASYGTGFGDNTAAMLMTRGMAEMSRLVDACGGSIMTVMGLAGAGDLIVTCTSEHSRNRTFGYLLAQGTTLVQYEEKTHMVVEGAIACKTILPLAEKYGVELPIAEGVRELVWESAPVEKLYHDLFNRPLKSEFWGLQ